MKKFYTLPLALAMTLGAWAEPGTFVSDFTDGLPSDIVAIDYDGMSFNEKDFATMYRPSNTWYVNLAPNEELTRDGVPAALSNSHRDDPNKSTDNWLITPEVEIGDDYVLNWCAKSIHYTLRENYKVMISTTGTNKGDFTELLSVNDEEYLWTRRSISLDKYKGSTVRIAFVHCSTNKFLLALRDIKIAEGEETDLSVRNRSPYYAGFETGDATLKATVTNHGKPIAANRLIAKIGDDTFSSQAVEGKVLQTGESIDFTVDIPVSLNQITDYSLSFEPTENNIVDLDCSGQIFCSYFPRRLMLEKFTSLTCTNCPQPNARILKMMEQMGNDIVVVEGHRDISVTVFSDPFAYVPYTGFVTQYPTLYLNRSTTIKANNVELPEAVYTEPTIANVDLKVVKNEDDTYTLVTDTEFAENIDNSNGFYRLGYIVKQDHYFLPDNYEKKQTWGGAVLTTSMAYSEFAYMPSYIPQSIMAFHDIAIGTPDAIIGEAGSLPTEIVAGEKYQHEYTLKLPQLLPNATELNATTLPPTDFPVNPNDITFVAFAIQAAEGKILNATQIPISEALISGISSAVANEKISIAATGTGLKLNFPSEDSWKVDLYTPSGMKAAEFQGSGNTSTLSTSLPSGIYIAKAIQGSTSTTVKIVL